VAPIQPKEWNVYESMLFGALIGLVGVAIRLKFASEKDIVWLLSAFAGVPFVEPLLPRREIGM
jgi:hypothetical protein